MLRIFWIISWKQFVENVENGKVEIARDFNKKGILFLENNLFKITEIKGQCNIIQYSR